MGAKKKGLKRDDMIPQYVDLLRRNAPNGEVIKLNQKIISTWSSSALIYIKDKAWKIFEEESKQPPTLVNMLVLGKFTDGKIRQIVTTKREQLNIASLLVQMSKDGKISATENIIQSLDWESNVDLRS